MLVGFASALTPTAMFNGTPVSGIAPLTVTFTDQSTGNPAGWAWYFGDENYTAPWTQLNASAGWSVRRSHSIVVMPDGSIVLMGGRAGESTFRNDVWRSMNNGVTWVRVNATPGWSARYSHSSVVMPDGSIILMGGMTGVLMNDVWRSTDNGTTWTEITPSAEWSARAHHSTVVLPDGSIVLMGGTESDAYMNDVWRSTDNGTTWTEMTRSAGWSPRAAHSSVVLQDGSIVLMGGLDASGNRNDVWRSTDNGTTWTRMTPGARWSARQALSSVAMPDGSIVLMGGSLSVSSFENDVWRSMDNGATWTEIPNAGWSARCYHTSVAMPDGSIVLVGGGSNISDKNDVWRFTTPGSSAQNPVHTYTIPGTYQVSLQAYNASSYDSTRKAGYITVYLTDDGGSDSGGDIPPPIPPNPTTTLTGTTINETVNVGGGSAVNRAEVTGTNLGKNLVVTAFPRNSLPSNIALTQMTVYQYISLVSSTIPGVVDQVILEFSVPQSWLTEHGFTAGDIVMMHYENGQWQELDTRYVSQKSGNVFYRATTPGFSYFAIVYRKDGTDMGAVTPVATTAPTLVAVLKAPVQEAPTTAEITREKTPAVPPAPVTQSSGGIPMTTIIVGTTGAIATVISTVLIRRWWIRKQNPTLFRKNDRY